MLPNVQRTDAADHVPVLAEEVRELLDVRPGETVVDATFGAGGHSRMLAADLAGSGKLVAIDRDPTVRPYFDRMKAGARGVQTRFLRGDYGVVLSQLAANGVQADVVLLDLGLSSMQVDRPERGFSYATDAPLDMRMDPSGEPSAAEVNHELESLEAGLAAAFAMLRPGGRIAVISFHSLEDRIVKRFFRDRAKGCTCPPELPVCVCGKEPDARVLTPKPVRPSAHEIDDNPRAASARLRVATRV